MRLDEFFVQNPCVALGFSGGVDSSYLLYAGRAAGAQVGAYYIRTVFQPRFEYEDAMRMARSLGAEVTVIETDILSAPCVAQNPPDRCYHCKKALFGLLAQRAREDGYSVLIDGTNASDDAHDRPGMRALRELQVRSPLRECNISKAEVRRLSREAGLFTWNKPAYACLATRVPAGEGLDAELLARVEAAEDALFQMGFSDFRVRVSNGAARLQFPQEQLARAFACREKINTILRPSFSAVLLDLAGRTGPRETI